MALEILRKPSPVLALATLLHDVGKPSTFSVKERIRFDGHVKRGAELASQICRRLKLSKDDKDLVVDLVANHLRFIHVKQMRTSTLKRFLRKDNFPDHLEMHRADCLSSHRDLGNYEYCLAKLAEFRREQISPAPLLTGRDLIEIGFDPGPILGRILREVETLQLEGALLTKSQAMQHVRENYPVKSDHR
jgi:poly(A) polymerase